MSADRCAICGRRLHRLLPTRGRGGVSVTTKHSHQPNFGRKVDGCPRCYELSEGFEPVRWAPSRRTQDEQRSAEIRDHFRSSRHLSGSCGPVCTLGDW